MVVTFATNVISEIKELTQYMGRVHDMNLVNSRNGSAMTTAPKTFSLLFNMATQLKPSQYLLVDGTLDEIRRPDPRGNPGRLL